MKKLFLSAGGGLIIGLALSFAFFDYQDISNQYIGLGGIDERIVRDMDFEFVFNASLLVIGISVLIYLIWTFIDKKKDEKFLKEFHGDK